MRAWRIAVAVTLVLLAALVTSCGELSCDFALPGQASTSTPTTTIGAATTSTATTSTATTSTATTSTATTSSTAGTTLAPIVAYRAEMKTWKNQYGAQLNDSYATISTMRNPARPSAKEIQAAQDLDRVLAEMVDALDDIRPPADLSAAHAAYLDSMGEMAHGAHDLAEAMKAGKSIRTVTAMTGLAVAWEKGRPARTALESALGFSLSG